MGFFTGSQGQLLLAPRDAVPNGRGVLCNANGDSVEKVIAKVKSWTFTSSTQTLDVTSLGDTDRVFREGLRSSSGNAQIFYYTNEDPTGEATNVTELIEYQLGKRKDPDAGTISKDEPEKFTLKFLMDRGKQNPYYLIGRCAITSMSITMAVGEIASANIAFDINGALVKYRI